MATGILPDSFNTNRKEHDMGTTNIFRQFNGSIANLVDKPAVGASLALAARLMASAIFITAGYGKLGAGYAGTEGYMASMGVPGGLLPLVIALEVGGGIALLVGFQARLVALLLAGFSITAGLIFHTGADQMQQIMLMKNFAMAGGLLAFTMFGAGRLSLDGEARA
jgi:putative oxidoreductase